jgi:hypothetical protein
MLQDDARQLNYNPWDAFHAVISLHSIDEPGLRGLQSRSMRVR